MSSQNIINNFNTFKYNLYEILNVSKTADNTKIKKNFIKLIKNFHPDKNSDLEEDIYYHIILANQILLNKESRIKYDNYINTKNNDFIELKQNFNNKIEIYKDNNQNDINSFKFQSNELNKKHGYNENINFDKIIDNFNKQKSNRTNKDIIIEKSLYQTKDEFNNNFKNNKLNNQIIEYIENPTELSTYINGELYTNLDDIDKLYIDDSIQNSIFSSLDKAFVLHPEIENISNDNNLSIKNKLENYKNDTIILTNMKFYNKSKNFACDEWYK